MTRSMISGMISGMIGGMIYGMAHAARDGGRTCGEAAPPPRMCCRGAGGAIRHALGSVHRMQLVPVSASGFRTPRTQPTTQPEHVHTSSLGATAMLQRFERPVVSHALTRALLTIRGRTANDIKNRWNSMFRREARHAANEAAKRGPRMAIPLPQVPPWEPLVAPPPTAPASLAEVPPSEAEATVEVGSQWLTGMAQSSSESTQPAETTSGVTSSVLSAAKAALAAAVSAASAASTASAASAASTASTAASTATSATSAASAASATAAASKAACPPTSHAPQPKVDVRVDGQRAAPILRRNGTPTTAPQTGETLTPIFSARTSTCAERSVSNPALPPRYICYSTASLCTEAVVTSTGARFHPRGGSSRGGSASPLPSPGMLVHAGVTSTRSRARTCARGPARSGFFGVYAGPQRTYCFKARVFHHTIGVYPSAWKAGCAVTEFLRKVRARA